MKKVISTLVISMMTFWMLCGGTGYSGEAVTVFMELRGTTTTLYPADVPGGDYLRGRVLFLDALGNLATIFNGAPIADATLELESLNFGTDVEFSSEPATKSNLSSTWRDSIAVVNLSGAWQEFAVSYDYVEEIGDDVILATLKKGTASLFAAREITVTAPVANCYVARTGGGAAIPEVLGTLPPQQSDFGAKRVAGDAVQIDVFAAYARDNNSNGVIDRSDLLIFTDNVPSGAEELDDGTLVNGHLAFSTTVKAVKATITATSTVADIAWQIKQMKKVFEEGKTFTYGPGSITKVEVGTHSGDVNSDGRVNLDNAASFKVDASHALTDTYKFTPADISAANIVGLPITGITGTLLTRGGGKTVDILDATDYLDITSYISDFKVNGTPGTTAVYGAIIGYDQYKNPAPFHKGQVVGFDLYTTTGKITSGIDIAKAGWGQVTSGTITATESYQAFLPFKITPTDSNTIPLYIKLHGNNPMKPTVIQGIDEAIEAISFGVFQNNIKSVGVPAINVEAGGKDSVNVIVQVTATASDSFKMKARKQTGAAVNVNIEGFSSPATEVNIPLTDADKAEQEVSFFSTVNNETLRLIFTGNTNKNTFVHKVSNAIVQPADPKDYPPSSVIAGFTRNATTDSEERHKELVTGSVSIKDAFGNSYSGTYGSTSVNMEDVKPVIEVFESDGTTPFPGASGKVDGQSVIVIFDKTKITPDASAATVKVSAGSASAEFTIGLRALNQTVLNNLFMPIPGIDDTPIELYFADQNGKLIAPLTRTTSSGVAGVSGYEGAYTVDLKAEDGIISDLSEKTFLQTSTPRRVFTAAIDADDADKIMTIAADGGDANATDTTLTLDFNPDFTPPEVGAVTVGNCSLSIAITDNKAVDLATSTVTVQKGDTGEDITATLTRTNTGDGAAAGSIDFTNVPIGSYTLTIVARDKVNNASASTSRTATVTECTPVTAACKTVDPTYGIIGETAVVTITGENTTFGATSTVAFTCTGVTVDSVTANSKTEIIAHITIAATAVGGSKCDVTVTTGTETVTCAEGFELFTTQPQPASCKSVSPASGDAGKSVQVTITGENTTFDATSTVEFSCAGIIDSVTANSATEIVATISIADDAADCTGNVTVKTGTETITCTDAFSVNAAAEECTLTVSPETIKTGNVFLRIKVITITGTSSNFSKSSEVKIDGINTIFILSASKTQIRALIIVPARLKGEKAVTVDDCTGGTLTFN